MFGFGKKKVSDSSSASSNNKGRSSADKERINDQLAKLGLIGIPGIDGGDNDSDVSDGDLENELLEIMGEEDPSDEKELLKFLQEDDDRPVPPKRVRQNLSSSTQKLPKQKEESPGTPETSPNGISKSSRPPTTIMESLEERLEKYKSEAGKAKSTGDAGKSRRMDRIVKQYEDAISSYKRGKPIVYEELPTPPGFAPIPFIPAPQPQNHEDSGPSSPTFDLPETHPISPAVELRNKATFAPTPVTSPPTHIFNSVEPAQTQDLIDISENTTTAELKQDTQLNIVLARQKQFKEAALSAKHRGDLAQAKEFLRMAKGFDKFILDAQTGVPVDLSVLPSAPESVTPLTGNDPEVPTSNFLYKPSGESNVLPTGRPQPDMKVVETLDQSELVPPESGVPAVDIFKAPPPASTIMEALEQRLEKYKSEVEKAKANADAGKSRRMGRIVKQYEDAISCYKKGKPVAYEELPTPPGFAPIPVSIPPQPPATTALPVSPSVPADGNNSAASPGDSNQKPTPPKQSGSINRGDNKPATKLTLQEKQLNTILARQKQFKEAALNAKQRGDLEQAKEFLRTAKGFDKLIGVSQAGLPVDMATLPSAPESVAALEAEDFELVSSSDCIAASGSAAEVFTKLEADLKEQLKVCMRTRDHFKSIGDVGSANRFEQMALESKRDLDTLRLAVKKGDAIPKYHYETKIFSITECNSDLGEDDVEINIIKGINFKGGDDVDTFVKVELPYPSAEEAQTYKTSVIKNSNNPDYNITCKMNINRSARNFPRFIHRHGVKLEVWSKGGLWYGITRRLIFCRRGLFRGNTLIGVATIKLSPLENKCTLHDAFEIMEGRKVVGKIEAKVRLRDPVVTKQITQKKQKWLSIDRV